MHPLTSNGGAFVLKLGLIFKKDTLGRVFFYWQDILLGKLDQLAGDVIGAHAVSIHGVPGGGGGVGFSLVQGHQLIQVDGIGAVAVVRQRRFGGSKSKLRLVCFPAMQI